ncbi:MAG: hypothetical protein KI786_04120 [Mameliella sp.]|nr:hypothetical protein [Phaeodactylibacter sp.]
MKMLIRTTLLLLVTLLITSSTKRDVRPGMVQFDQAFLPALEYTLQANTHDAKKAVFFLEFRWRRLRNQLANHYTQEQETLRRIDDWLGDAYYAIDANRPHTAANQLEHVKYELMVLRSYYQIDYYLDDLYDFQGGLELLTEAAADEKHCLMEWGEFVALGKELRLEWQYIVQKPFDQELYLFDDQKAKQLKYKQRAMSDALYDFAEATKSADRKNVAIAAKKLLPHYNEVLRLFGDYQSTQTYFARHITLLDN